MAKIKLPVKEALLDAMSVAETSVEAADYLASRFKEILTRAKMTDTYADVLQKVEDFAKYTQFKLLSAAQPWRGQSSNATEFTNLQSNMANEAAKNLESMNIGTEKEVLLDFAINNQGDFIRGYSSGGKALSDQSLESMDKLFNAWLAENNVVSQDSIFYESNKNGEIIKDEDGRNMIANPDQIKDLVSDPEKGFQKYLDLKGINLTTQQHEYPSAQKEMQTKNELKDAIRESTQETPEADAQSGMKAGA